MKKNKLKYLLITMLGIALVPFNTSAATYKGTAGVTNLNGATRYEDLIYSNGKSYTDYSFQVTINGVNYNDGYCIDFGYHMNSVGNGGSAVSCQVATNAAITAILNSGAEHAVKQIALRILSAEIGYTKQQVYTVTTTNHEIYKKAVELVNSAKSTTPGSDYMIFSKSKEEDKGDYVEITFNVKSLTTSLRDVNFTCQDCEILNSSWNSTDGQITIKVSSGDCEYKIIPSYVPVGVDVSNITTEESTFLYCTGTGNTQNTIFNISGVTSDITSSTSNETTTVVGSRVVQRAYVGQITNTGGEYYKTYCSNPEDENSCNQKTEFYIPPYCDDAGDEKVTITAPTDIKNCILNSNDEAGNTYQDTNLVSASNRFCAVYCKEDYEMNLPGAQYADSGRYFELKNVSVTGTRTCYATGPNSSTPNIDIEGFISKVQEAQKNLINEYNEYLKRKTLYDTVFKKECDANGENCKDVINTDNVNVNNEQYNLKADLYYTPKDLDCSSSTGVCTIKDGTRAKIIGTSDWWGNKPGETRACVWTETYDYDRTSWSNAKYSIRCSQIANGMWECRVEDNFCSPTTAGESQDAPDWNYADYLTKVNEANTALNGIINEMEACYSWATNGESNYCLDPNIEFDYKEYNIDKKFEKVPEKSENKVTAVYFGTNKDIDNQYSLDTGAYDLGNYGYLKCDENGCSQDNIAQKIGSLSDENSKVYYIKKVSKASEEYKNAQEFQTNYPHGTIEEVTDPTKIQYNYSYLGAVFPIALNTNRGVYQWTLNFTNLGQYNNSSKCSNGRLNDVAKALNVSTSTDVEYVCVYVVDCPDCDYECIGDYCEIPDPDPKCPDCDVYCVNCIFDGKNTYFYRTISLNEFNSSGRNLGANWTSDKGIKAQNEIESNGEEAYIEAEYTFVMTASNMKAIRDYNAQTGTYISEDLSYESVNNVNNIAGYSYFLRDKNNKNDYNRDFFKSATLNNTWELYSGTLGDNVGPAWK